MTERLSALVCSGCGYTPPAHEAFPFRCARAIPGDDIDHVLVHRLKLDALSASHRASAPAAPRDYWSGVFLREETNPFLHYREFLYSWHVALDQGLSEDDWCDLV
jgi:hypothetical protein